MNNIIKIFSGAKIALLCLQDLRITLIIVVIVAHANGQKKKKMTV